MENSDFIKELLSALDRPEIRSKIINLYLEESSVDTLLELDCQETDFFELESANKELKNSISILKDNHQLVIDELNNKIKSLKEKYDDLLANNDSLRKENKELKNNLRSYRDDFSDDIEITRLYSELSEETKQSLSGIFKDSSSRGLVSCGIQEKNISNLWDYAKGEIVGGKNQDQENLVKLFCQLFERFKLAFPMFEMCSSSSGDSFDIQKHIKHNNSKGSNGPIKEILLPGYYNKNTRKTIKMTVVII